jgi:chemotaxis protein methyltransferase CheR
MLLNLPADDMSHVVFTGKSSSSANKSAQKKYFVKKTYECPGKENAIYLHPLIRTVFSHASLNPKDYRREHLQRRLNACLRSLKAKTVQDALDNLEEKPYLAPAAVSSLLIGVTEFFRDAAVFDFIYKEIIGSWASEAKTFRIWSAACANGAELRSILILLSEAGLLDRSFLLGTDCRSEAIEEAKAGKYLPGLSREVEQLYIERYFKLEGNSRQFIEPDEAQIEWKLSNVLETVEKGPWDMILFRNAGIYITSSALAKVWDKFAENLYPGGFLITGKAEKAPPEFFERLERSVYRRRTVA